MTYDNDENKLALKGDVFGYSVTAVRTYKLYVDREEREVLFASRDPNAQNGSWEVRLDLNNDTYINLVENNGIEGEFGWKDYIDIYSHDINLYGNIHSSTGQIVTSDRNLKNDIQQLTDKHITFFSLLQPVSFTFIDGESGRTHIGFISQDVEDAMSQAGLTDLDFAGFCRTVKTKEFVDEDGNKTREIEKDENGNPVYVYALRYEEFIALNTFMIQNLLEGNKNLCDKVQTLQNENQDIHTELHNIREENQDIKERLMRLEEKQDNLG